MTTPGELRVLLGFPDAPDPEFDPPEMVEAWIRDHDGIDDYDDRRRIYDDERAERAVEFWAGAYEDGHVRSFGVDQRAGGPPRPKWGEPW